MISGTLKAGRQLTCSAGSWANDPTGFAFQWIRNGTTLDGATGDTYTLGTLDEGTTLTCVVTAINAAGRASATSDTVKVPIPYVRRCPGATGAMTGTTIGLIQLGMTRSRARFLYRRHSNRGRQYRGLLLPDPDRGTRRLRLTEAAPASLPPRTGEAQGHGRVVLDI